MTNQPPPQQILRTLDQTVSYCGLCVRLDESAGKSKRGPLSKQRNSHLQRVLIDAKLDRAGTRSWGRSTRASVSADTATGRTVEVARALAARLREVDRRGTPHERR